MSWRSELVARITAVADFGNVYEFERYDKANNLNALKALYLTADIMAGGFLKMTQANVQADVGTSGKQISVELALFSQWVDTQSSQLVFDNKLEALLDDAATNARLSDESVFKTQNNQVGWQLVSNGPAMFGGVLVHMAKLRCTLYSLS